MAAAAGVERRAKFAIKSTNDPTVIESPQVTFASSAGTTHRIRSNANLSWPNANVSYNGEFDIGRFVYMKYLHRF